MHAHADVPFAADRRLACVHPHAHAQLLALRPRVRCQRPLRVDGGADGILHAAGRGEEGVALRVDLRAVVLGQGGADDPLVVGERRPVLVAQLLEHARRALDVGEQEGDGAGRPLGGTTHRLVVHLQPARLKISCTTAVFASA